MYNRLRAARENASGFTLIELLIVIVILGVLAGIVVFSVQAFNNDGKQSACQTDLKTMETAVEAYYAKNASTWPASFVALQTAGYIREVPSTTNGYTITLGANGAVTGDLTGHSTGNCS